MGIWKYNKNFEKGIDQKYWLSIDEGNTPLEQISFEGKDLYLKREDHNPTGSHKDRGLAYQISAHISEGKSNFVISSSGNASISAIALLKNSKYALKIFLSPKLNDSKKFRLSKELGKEIEVGKDQQVGNISIHFTHRAVSNAFKFAKQENKTLLRGSTDNYAIPGYSTISYELQEQLPSVTDIFIPSSSGTTALGVYRGFNKSPRIHICQTTYVNTLVRNNSNKFEQSDSSFVDSIVDRVGHRKDDILKILSAGGYGWVISNNEINEVKKSLSKIDIDISNEGLLAFSSYLKALDSGLEMSQPVILISGAK